MTSGDYYYKSRRCYQVRSNYKGLRESTLGDIKLEHGTTEGDSVRSGFCSATQFVFALSSLQY